MIAASAVEPDPTSRCCTKCCTARLGRQSRVTLNLGNARAKTDSQSLAGTNTQAQTPANVETLAHGGLAGRAWFRKLGAALGSNAQAAISEKVVQAVIATAPVCQLSRTPAGFLCAEVAPTHDGAGLVCPGNRFP
jgi:hypothetical protein